jgi:hypothetical protein
MNEMPLRLLTVPGKPCPTALVGKLGGHRFLRHGGLLLVSRQVGRVFRSFSWLIAIDDPPLLGFGPLEID